MTDLKHLPKGYDEPLNKMTEKEWEEYCTRVSSWEIAKYMVMY